MFGWVFNNTTFFHLFFPDFKLWFNHDQYIRLVRAAIPQRRKQQLHTDEAHVDNNEVNGLKEITVAMVDLAGYEATETVGDITFEAPPDQEGDLVVNYPFQFDPGGGFGGVDPPGAKP